jgi:Protein of unknown function (DUF3052)
MTSGYSGTPLPQKLGIKSGARLCAQQAPANYRELLAPLPAGVKFVRTIDDQTDLVHLFTTRRTELAAALRQARRAMREDAVIWVSWPKKSAGVATDVTEDTVRDVALPLGLVDIKVCAVDATWSGLKLMIRRSERTPQRRPAPRRTPA